MRKGGSRMFKGIAASKGYAIGRVFLMREETIMLDESPARSEEHTTELQSTSNLV